MSSKKKVRAELSFEVVILGVLVVLVISSFGVSSLSRRFPLGVALLTILMLVIRMVQVIRTSRTTVSRDTDENAQQELADFSPWRKAFPALLWTAALVGGFYTFGIVFGGIIFTFCFVKLYGRQSKMTAVLSSLVVLAIVYGVFGLVMQFPLYSGFLRIPLPGIFLR